VVSPGTGFQFGWLTVAQLYVSGLHLKRLDEGSRPRAVQVCAVPMIVLLAPDGGLICANRTSEGNIRLVFDA